MMTVQDIRESYFTEEASLVEIRGVDGNCLQDAFDDPDETYEARLFLDLLDGWGREPIRMYSPPRPGSVNYTRGLIWYCPRQLAIVVVFHNHEIQLFFCEDLPTFETRLAQIRVASTK